MTELYCEVGGAGATTRGCLRHFGWKLSPADIQYSESVQVKSIFLATLIKKSLYSDSHLPLIITMWNHRLGRERRAVALPALLPQTIKLPRRASRYTLPHCTQHQCVYWIQDPVINKFSIFSPSGASPTSKEVKDGVVSLCACAFYCIKQPGFQPRDTGGEQPRKFNFMTTTSLPARWGCGSCALKVSPAPG